MFLVYLPFTYAKSELYGMPNCLDACVAFKDLLQTALSAFFRSSSVQERLPAPRGARCLRSETTIVLRLIYFVEEIDRPILHSLHKNEFLNGNKPLKRIETNWDTLHRDHPLVRKLLCDFTCESKRKIIIFVVPIALS